MSARSEETWIRAVLGIDAAWTLKQPSGVALVAQGAGGWHLIAAESSYQRFESFAGSSAEISTQAELKPNPAKLLASAKALCACPIVLIAIDMPLAFTAIDGRRNSDNAVSSRYGARKCGTHTPSVSRPGHVSENLRTDFEKAGYPLLTKTVKQRGIIEVYPHPALVELAKAPKRLPYKFSKHRHYKDWGSATASERRCKLLRQWDEIVTLLESEITGVKAHVPMLEPSAKNVELKAYEDTLDAIICAWVAVCTLEGRATPFGDGDSAIWIPNPLVR